MTDNGRAASRRCRRRGRRATVAGLCAAVLGTAAAPAPTPTVVQGSGLPSSIAVAPSVPPPAAPPTHASLEPHRAAVTATLDAVADAFLTADPAALRPWLADPDGRFGQRWLARASNLRDVPLSAYTLSLDTSLADLTSPDVPGDDGLLVSVLERHQLVGMEELGPAEEYLFLTLRPDGDRWLVADDTHGERLGLVSVDHLWDHGPVVATGDGPIVALHHPGQASVGTLLEEAAAALRTTQERWPLPWPGRVPLLVPRDQDELAELLHVTYDLSNFIAFATTTPTGELGDVEMAGSRVMLNTGRFLSRPSATRERILVHELVHAASRPSSAPYIPSWMEEGVAQALGEERSTTGTSLLSSLARTDWPGTLPEDTEFSSGSRDQTFLSYQRAWSFVDWLVQQHGRDGVGAFYSTVGAAADQPGTTHARIDLAARAVFGASMEELRAAWRASL